jgi:3'-phosphoadenosine 5'-phosphosulfate (PAPS) 3'-phosphatase
LNHTDFQTVVEIMEQLGHHIVEWRNDPSARKQISDKGFKLEADLRAHEYLIEHLSLHFPAIPILSEEDSSHKEMRPEKYWLIDPIDGTASWLEGFDGFVTQAAYIENCEPVYGIIHAPILKKTYTAVKNQGAIRNSVLLPSLKYADRLVITDNTPNPHGVVKTLSSNLSATGYKESGSLGLKCCLVADGTADLFVKCVTVRDWDIAPAWLVLKEVNGFITVSSGEAYNFSGPMEKPEGIIVARDQHLWQRVCTVVNS